MLFIFLFSVSPSWAQTIPPDIPAHHFDMSEFPQWAKNLRRGEIIAFGAYPLSYFFTNFGYDAFRWSTNSWDNRYAPWPFNSAGTVEKSQGEQIAVIGIAAGLSVVIALVDYGIVRARRNRLERQSREYPIDPPVIIRTPMSEETE